MDGNDDITWAQMWAEEERQASVGATDGGSVDAPVAAEWDAEAPLTLAPEPYFGEPVPYRPQPQPYFELRTEPTVEEGAQPPALRVRLPVAEPKRVFRPDSDHPVEQVDWQAPLPPSDSSGPRSPEQQWEATWADGISLHRDV